MPGKTTASHRPSESPGGLCGVHMYSDDEALYSTASALLTCVVEDQLALDRLAADQFALS
jgi:hypothetical protein